MTPDEFNKQAKLPISSERAAAMTWKEAIEHSLNKWKIADQFKTDVYGGTLDFEDGSITFGMKNCALCVKAMADSNGRIMCDVCPLKNYTKSCSGNEDQPWGIFIDTGNMKPMISALETCLREYEE